MKVNIHNNIQKIPVKNFFNIFCHIKVLLQQWNKNYFKKIHHQLFNNQSIELRLSSEIDHIIQEGEVVFKKNPTLGFPEVSKLIESAMSKRQGDQ